MTRNLNVLQKRLALPVAALGLGALAAGCSAASEQSAAEPATITVTVLPTPEGSPLNPVPTEPSSTATRPEKKKTMPGDPDCTVDVARRVSDILRVTCMSLGNEGFTLFGQDLHGGIHLFDRASSPLSENKRYVTPVKVEMSSGRCNTAGYESFAVMKVRSGVNAGPFKMGTGYPDWYEIVKQINTTEYPVLDELKVPSFKAPPYMPHYDPMIQPNSCSTTHFSAGTAVPLAAGIATPR